MHILLKKSCSWFSKYWRTIWWNFSARLWGSAPHNKALGDWVHVIHYTYPERRARSGAEGCQWWKSKRSNKFIELEFFLWLWKSNKPGKCYWVHVIQPETETLKKICISSDIENDFSCQWRVKNKKSQGPLFPSCLLLVTAGVWVLAWKASYWPYYILIKSKLFSGLQQRFFCSEKKIFAGYFRLWSLLLCRGSEASQVMVRSAGDH